MQDYPLNTEHTLRLQFLDSGLPLTGGTVTITVYDPTGAVIVNTGSCSEEGGGYYSYVLSSSLVGARGIYHSIWKLNKSGIALQEDDYFSVGYATQVFYSLRETRWAIARLENDLITGQALTGTDQSCTDEFFSLHPSQSLKGRYFYIYAGTNYRQKSRRVLDHQAATVMLTPAYSSAIDNTSLYELHSKWPVEDYNNAIQLAVESIAKISLTPYVDESLTVPTTESGVVDIPEGFTHVFKVEIEALDKFPQEVSPANWRIVPGKRQMRIAYHLCADYFGKKLILHGLTRPVVPLADHQIVSAPIEYVVKKSLSYLLGMKADSRGADAEAMLKRKMVYEQEAMVARNMQRSFAPPNSRPVT